MKTDLFWVRAGVALVALAVAACGREPSGPVGRGRAALESTSAAEPSLDREVEALEAELAELPVEERFEVRTARVREAEEAARRRSVDEGGDVMETLLTIRDRMAETVEAHAEHEAAEAARVLRNESGSATAEDLENARQLERTLGMSADLEARAQHVTEVRAEDIERARRHVDPSEALVNIDELEFEGTVDPVAMEARRAE